MLYRAVNATAHGLWLSLLLGLPWVSVPAVQAQPSPVQPATPVEVVAALHAGIVAAAADHGSTGLAERYATLRPLVLRTHDLPNIARVTIRRQWGMLTIDQQQRFLEAFERLSVMTYANRFASVSADTFALIGSEDAGSGRVLVRAKIVRDDGDISLDYLLQEGEGGWQIINILADQVSDLALKRAEYQQILSAGSIDDLIAEIESQTARLQ